MRRPLFCGTLAGANSNNKGAAVAATSEALADPSPLTRPGNRAQRAERLFFSSIAVALLVIVFVGFAPTYFLRNSFGSPALTPSLQVHGLLFTSWMILLFVQTSLVAASKTAWHRRLGIVGALLGVLMMVAGAYVAITRARTGLATPPPPGLTPAVVLTLPLATLVVFPALFGTALWFRRRTDVHKRLVIIATLELVTAAVARWPVISTLGPVAFFGVTDAFVVALAVYDFKTRGRIHPATLWGGLFLIVWQPLRIAIGFTAPWQTFVNWLIA
jgi:hypothetical protein